MDLLQGFSFELPTRIEYGPGSLSGLGPFLDELGASRVLVVSDSGLRGAGVLSSVLGSPGLRGRHVESFEEVSPNPKDVEAEAGAEKARGMGAEALVAVGGGSVLDCAKAVGVLAPQGGRTRDYEARGSIGPEVLPLIALPTTAGSASEVTFSAVITDSEDRFKFTLKDVRIAPRIALLDPELTRSMPPDLTAATGMDALTHAVESFTAPSAHVLSDAAALQAVDLVSAHLVRAVSRGDDLEARAGMLLGSVLAGIAFSHSDVGAVHCIAEAMGGIYDAPHGACNAVVLPEMMAWNREACPERYARIASAMGIGATGPDRGAEAAVEAVRGLAKEVGLPGVRELGLRREDFGELARRSVRNGSNASNPRVMTEADYIRVLERLWEASSNPDS
jgi:alcohol dehydrogenase